MRFHGSKRSSWPGFQRELRMGRKSRLFMHSLSSLDSHSAELEVEMAESLRPYPRIFPFCGDYRRRLVRSRLPPLIAPTQALQERRCLGILHGLVLCSCILYGRDLYPCILLPPDLCSGISLGPDLCPRILLGPDVSVLFHGPDLWSSVSHNLCWGILYGV